MSVLVTFQNNTEKNTDESDEILNLNQYDFFLKIIIF